MTQGIGRNWVFVFFLLAVPGLALAKAPTPKDDDYELFRKLVDAVDQIQHNYVTDVDRRELVDSAIRGMLSKLDPYSTYIAAD